MDVITRWEFVLFFVLSILIPVVVVWRLLRVCYEAECPHCGTLVRGKVVGRDLRDEAGQRYDSVDYRCPKGDHTWTARERMVMVT
ncbi:MAG: hypothetical protein WC757_04755 [Candidatus Paceibacterota bacterium]|jgi:hypothetical protein